MEDKDLNEEVKAVEETAENVEETAENVEKITNDVAPLENNLEEDEILNKKKNNKTVFVILGIIVILLIAILTIGYKMFFNSKQIFLNSVNKEYKELEKIIDDVATNTKKDKKTVLVSQEYSINAKLNESLVDEDTQSILDEINKTKIKSQIGYDLTNKKMLLNVDTTYNNKDLINLGVYLEKQKMYLDLKNLFDKYIEIPVDNYDEIFKENDENVEDLKYILSKTKNSIVKNLDKKEFKSENKTIKIDEKDIKVTKISYGLSEKNTNELAKKILTDLKNDKKFISKLATISGKTETEIKESVEEQLEEINDNIKNGDLSTKEEIVFSIYVKRLTKQNVGFELSAKDSETEEDYLFTYYKNNKIKEFNFYSEEEKVLNITANNNKVVTKFEGDTPVTITINKKEEDKKTIFEYEISASGASIEGSLVSKILTEEKNKVEKEITFEAKIISSGMELGSLNITGTETSEYDTEINVPEIKNKIKYENLTEEDYEKIQNKLMENEGLKELIEKMNKESDLSI